MLALAWALAVHPSRLKRNGSAAAPDYAKDSNWLCLPGRADACSTPLPTTVLTPSGYGSTGPSTVAKDPPLDCFYVYPTVSSDPAMNSDMNAGREEKLAARDAVRPLRVGLPAVRAGLSANDPRRSRRLCGRRGHQRRGQACLRRRARRVAQLFRTRNGGRPFVLIGHSQGSLMLQQLIPREIETDPALAARMKLAIIPASTCWCRRGSWSAGRSRRFRYAAAPAKPAARSRGAAFATRMSRRRVRCSAIPTSPE